MLYFNELRLLDDRKYILIDVLVRDTSYYEDVFINHIEVHTPKTFDTISFINDKSLVLPEEFVPSLDLLIPFHPEPSLENPLEYFLKVRHYRGFIPIDGCADNLFFICVSVAGDVSSELACVSKLKTIVGVVYDKLPIYQRGMKLLSELLGCQTTDNLKDFILLKKAFDISLLAGNYTNVIKYWNLLTENKEATITRNCDCHGTV